MKLELYRDVDTPPGGWRMTVAETGLTIRAASAKVLQGKVYQHMEANSLPMPAPFEAWFQDQLCSQMGLGEPFCGPVRKTMDKQTANLSREMIVRFLKTMWALWEKGFQLVTQEQADARASVCAACPLNVTWQFSCWKCETLLALVGKILGKRKTTYEAKLNFCSACGCKVSLKCWVPKDVLDAAEAGSKPEYAAGCWRLSEGEK